MRRNIAHIIFILACLEPEYFTSIAAVHVIFTALRIVALLYVLLCHMQKYKFTRFDCALLLFVAVNAAATFIAGGSVISLLGNSLPLICLCFLVKIMAEDSMKACLHNLSIVFSWLVVVNFLFYILLPNGYSSYYATSGLRIIRYFLGVDNQFGSYLIPGIAVACADSLHSHGKLNANAITVCICAFATMLISGSGSAVIGSVLLLLYIIFALKRPLSRAVSVTGITITYIAAYCGLLFYGIQEKFMYFIENVLDKDVTLSSRTEIWRLAFEKIAQCPIFGYGYIEGGKYIMLSGELPRSAHNTILQVVLQGGIVLLAAFLLCIGIALHKARHNQKNHTVNLLIMTLFTMFVMMLVEVYQFTTIFMLLAICFYSDKIKDGTDACDVPINVQEKCD